MQLDWKNITEIAEELSDKYQGYNPTYINFVDLRERVLSLDNFVGAKDSCNEKVLEAIQAAWLEEIA